MDEAPGSRKTPEASGETGSAGVHAKESNFAGKSQEEYEMLKLFHTTVFLTALLFSGAPFHSPAAEETAAGETAAKFESTRRQCAPGLRLEQRRYPEFAGAPLSVSILTLESGAKFRPALAVCENGQRRTVSEFAEQRRAAAAINAGFFTFEPVSRGVWPLKADGVMYSSGKPPAEGGAFAFEKDGRFRLLPAAEYRPETWTSLVSGDRMLLTGGKNTAPEQGARAPRTAVGTAPDGRLVLLVIDGRTAESAGATLRETAEFLREAGCTDALNLDGGGSSTMWTARDGVVSHPCDNGKFDHAGERRVHNALLLLPE